MNDKRRRFLKAAIALAGRSDTSRFQAKCQASSEGAHHFNRRSELQQRGSLRLLKIAEVLT